MQSSKASKAHHKSTTSPPISKRNRQHGETTLSKPESLRVFDLTGDAPSGTDPKRQKRSHSFARTGKQHGMLRDGGGVLGRIMTDTSGFQPQTGAKRLVIKNLRKSSPGNLEEYYAKTWQELDTALTSIFDRKTPETPLEILCRGVEAMCRGGKAEELFRHLEKRCKSHLDITLLSRIEKNAQSNSVELLRAVINGWRTWNNQLVSGTPTS